MEKADMDYQELFAELTAYEHSGVRIQMGGIPASPMQIVSAHMLCEGSGYMRDYILDEKGILEELNFDQVGNQKTVE